tara:strand:- start:291 stop:848 length:558 start_codon:yes stop_codon:yes gene_type:complete
MFEDQLAEKKRKNEKYLLNGNYEEGFFTPFSEKTDERPGFSHSAGGDFKRNTIAVVMRPMINAVIAMGHLLQSVLKFTLGTINLIVGLCWWDANEAFSGVKNMARGLQHVIDACYFAISIITDFLDAAIRLVTHSLTTITQPVITLIDESQTLEDYYFYVGIYTRVNTPHENPQDIPQGIPQNSF